MDSPMCNCTSEVRACAWRGRRRCQCCLIEPLTPPLNGGTFNSVKITFDPVKRQTALDKRGLEFADAAIIFAGLTITVEDTRRDYGEARSDSSLIE